MIIRSHERTGYIYCVRNGIRRKLLIVLKSIHYLFITAGGDTESVANGFSVSKSNCVQYWCGKLCVCFVPTEFNASDTVWRGLDVLVAQAKMRERNVIKMKIAQLVLH